MTFLRRTPPSALACAILANVIVVSSLTACDGGEAAAPTDAGHAREDEDEGDGKRSGSGGDAGKDGIAKDAAVSDVGADSEAPSSCTTTDVGPSSSGAFDLLYEGGNTHVVYLATASFVPVHRERKTGSSTFETGATFPSSGNHFGYRDVALSMDGAALRVLAAKAMVGTDVFARNGSAFVAGSALSGTNQSTLIRLKSFVDSSGGLHAAAIFSQNGGLFFRHLVPSAVDWPLPVPIAPSVGNASLAFAPNGHMVVAYSKADGSVTAVRRDGADVAKGSTEIALATPVDGEFAIAASADAVSLLYSTSAWYLRTSTASEQVSTAKPAYGTPDLVQGSDGVLRAVVYEPSGISATAHLLERRGGSWKNLASMKGRLARAFITPSGGTAMLVQRDQPSPTSDDVALVECD